MSEPVNTVSESITTVDDEGSVNERLSTGGPGPEGQADTVVERLSGHSDPVEPEPAEAEPAPEPAPEPVAVEPEADEAQG